MGFPRDLFAQTSVQPKKDLPPAYNPNHESKPAVDEKPALVRRGPRNYVLKGEVIKATDPPKWLWNTKQCRQWLLDLYMNHLQMDPQEAKAKAEAFDGCGSTLYIATAHEWTWMLGRNAGAGVYGMLYGFRSAEGAVPKDVALKAIRSSLKKGLRTRGEKDFENTSIAIWGGRDKPFGEETEDFTWDSDSIWSSGDKVEDDNKVSGDTVTEMPPASGTDTSMSAVLDVDTRGPNNLIAVAPDNGKNGAKGDSPGEGPH